ncbi:23S rRNA (guanosine(2251)-2'-O)-methyltransferase RlmB [uncultured Fibrella sp.]|uniref:23S rRNA (guanosine(2251)-2'-O)-methyltransferase RlmB n=1 Tax=uncultured Fibrella sp. TaxID=1284596 RepID=UPI0035CA296A
MENRRNSRVNTDTNRSDESFDDGRPRDFTRPSEPQSGAAERSDSPVGRSRPAARQDVPEQGTPERKPFNRSVPTSDRPSGRSFDRRREEGRGPYSKPAREESDDHLTSDRPTSDRPERSTSDGPRQSGPRQSGGRPPRSGGYDKPRPEFRPESDEMVYGIQSVIETLRSGQQIDKLYMEKELSNPDIQTLAFQNRVTIQRVPVEKLDRLTRKNHQGVVCLVAAVQYVKLSNVMADVHERGEVPFLLLLDRITDVRNFGAIARTAECAGVQCIVIPGKGSAAINSDAMKTSSGALNHISVCREFDLVDTIKFLQKSGVQVIACTEKSHRDLYAKTSELQGPLAIVMGSEDDGISPEILRVVDNHVKIPLLGEVGSLNVSVATGVVLYEVVRQRALEE